MRRKNRRFTNFSAKIHIKKKSVIEQFCDRIDAAHTFQPDNFRFLFFYSLKFLDINFSILLQFL